MNAPQLPPGIGVATAPPLRRTPMPAQPWFGLWRGLLFALWPGLRFAAPALAHAPWQAAATRRRRVLLALVGALAGGALLLQWQAAPQGLTATAWAQALLAMLLFAWVGAGFVTALMGAWVMYRGDRHGLALRDAHAPIDRRARTAIVMPICNEDVATAFAGLRATCESLAATGALSLFDIYILSDSSDPALRAAELHAWQRLRNMLGDAPMHHGARIFYRWRRRRTRRKAGNVADFCRRWGANYRYMVVLDADSVMHGDTLVALVRLMEQHPRAGLVQTLPQGFGHGTVHARLQQFGNRVTGRLFALGMAYWQLGESHYWGHNAILRVEPFMRHCGAGPAARPRRTVRRDPVARLRRGRADAPRRLRGLDGSAAGRQLGAASGQLAGGTAARPPLVPGQSAKRQAAGRTRLARRAPRHARHRSAVLPGGAAVAGLRRTGPVVRRLRRLEPGAVAADLAAAVPAAAAGCAGGATARRAGAFGGSMRLWGSAWLELLLSALQAPLRLLAHSAFVLSALTALRLDWKSPAREAAAVAWRDALSRIGVLALPALGLALLMLALHGQPAQAAYLAPLLLPLLLAVPFTVWSGSARPGRRLQRAGLLAVPEEREPPHVLARSTQKVDFSDLAPSALIADVLRPAVSRRTSAWMALASPVLVTLVLLPRTALSPELPPGLQSSLMALAPSSKNRSSSRCYRYKYRSPPHRRYSAAGPTGRPAPSTTQYGDAPTRPWRR